MVEEDDPFNTRSVRYNSFSDRVQLLRAVSAEERVETSSYATRNGEEEDLLSGNRNARGSSSSSAQASPPADEPSSTPKHIRTVLDDLNNICRLGQFYRAFDEEALMRLAHDTSTPSKQRPTETPWTLLPGQDKLLQRLKSEYAKEKLIETYPVRPVDPAIFAGLLRDLKQGGEGGLHCSVKNYPITRPKAKKRKKRKSIKEADLKRLSTNNRKLLEMNKAAGGARGKGPKGGRKGALEHATGEIHNLLSCALNGQSLEQCLMAVKVMLCEMDTGRVGDRYTHETSQLVKHMLQTWAPDSRRLKADIFAVWGKKFVKTWQCRSSLLVMEKCPGQKLYVDDNYEGNIVIKGESVKLRVNSSPIASGSATFEIRLLGNVSKGSQCQSVRMGWIDCRTDERAEYLKLSEANKGPDKPLAKQRGSTGSGMQLGDLAGEYSYCFLEETTFICGEEGASCASPESSAKAAVAKVEKVYALRMVSRDSVSVRCMTDEDTEGTICGSIDYKYWGQEIFTACSKATDAKGKLWYKLSNETVENSNFKRSKGYCEEKIAGGGAWVVMEGSVELYKPPICKKGHKMEVSAYAEGAYAGGYICDMCRGNSSKDPERWFCKICHADFCFACLPKVSFTQNDGVDGSARIDIANGDVLGCQIDISGRKLFYYKNGKKLDFSIDLPSHDSDTLSPFTGYLPALSMATSGHRCNLALRLSKSVPNATKEGKKLKPLYKKNISNILTFGNTGSTRVTIATLGRLGLKRNTHNYIESHLQVPGELRRAKWHVLLSQGKTGKNLEDDYEPVYDNLSKGKTWGRSGTIHGRGLTAPKKGGFEVGVTDKGALFVRFYDSCTIQSAPNAVQEGMWHQIGISIYFNSKRSHLSCQFFVDQILVDSIGHVTGLLTKTDDDLVIGGRHRPSLVANGETADFDVAKKQTMILGWSGSVASLQIWKSIYPKPKWSAFSGRSASVSNERSIMGYWKCNEGGSSRVLHDSVVDPDGATGYHGVIHFGPDGGWGTLDIHCIVDKMNRFGQPHLHQDEKGTPENSISERVQHSLATVEDSGTRTGFSVLTGVLCALERLAQACLRVHSEERMGQTVGVTALFKSIAFSPNHRVVFLFLHSILDHLFRRRQYYRGASNPELIGSATLSSLRLFFANLVALQEKNKSPKQAGLADSQFVKKVRSVLIALATGRMADDGCAHSTCCEIQEEASKILAKFIKIFFASPSSRRQLVIAMFSKSNDPAVYAEAFNVSMKYVGPKQSTLLRNLCKFYSASPKLLDELLHEECQVIKWHADGVFESQHIAANAASQDRKISFVPPWSKNHMNAFVGLPVEDDGEIVLSKKAIIDFFKLNAPKLWLEERNLHWSTKHICKSLTREKIAQLYTELLSNYEAHSGTDSSAQRWTVAYMHSSIQNTVRNAFENILNLPSDSNKEVVNFVSMINRRLFGLFDSGSFKEPPAGSKYPVDNFLSSTKEDEEVHQSTNPSKNDHGFDESNIHETMMLNDSCCEVTHDGTSKWGSVATKHACPPNSGTWTWVFRVDRCDFGRAFVGLAPYLKVITDKFVGGVNNGYGLMLQGKLQKGGRVENMHYCERIFPGSLIFMTYDSDSNRLLYGNYSERLSYGAAFSDISNENAMVPVISLKDKDDKISFVNFFFGAVLNEEYRGSPSKVRKVTSYSPPKGLVLSNLAVDIFEDCLELLHAEIDRVSASKSGFVNFAKSNHLLKIVLPQLVTSICLWKSLPFNRLEKFNSKVFTFLQLINCKAVEVEQENTSLHNLQVLLHSLMGVIVTCMVDCERYTDYVKFIESRKTSLKDDGDVYATTTKQWFDSCLFDSNLRNTSSADWLNNSSPAAEFLKNVIDGANGSLGNLLFEWLFEHVSVHIMVKKWYRDIMVVARHALASLVYHSGMLDIALNTMEEMYVCIVKYIDFSSADANITPLLRLLSPPETFGGILSSVSSILTKIQRSSASVSKQHIQNIVRRKTDFLLQYNPSCSTKFDTLSELKKHCVRLSGQIKMYFDNLNAANGMDSTLAKSRKAALTLTSLGENSELFSEMEDFFTASVNIQALKESMLRASMTAKCRANGLEIACKVLRNGPTAECTASFLVQMRYALKLPICSDSSGACSKSARKSVASKYYELYKLLARLLKDATNDSNCHLQLCLFNVCGVEIKQGNNELIKHAGIFQVLQTALHMHRDWFSGVKHAMGNAQLIFHKDLSEKAALKVVVLVASQMFLPGQKVEEDHVQVVLDLLYQELLHAVQSISERKNAVHEGEVGSETSINGTENIEMFVGEISSLLSRISEVPETVTELSKRKWLSLLLELLHCSPSHIQRRIMRLFRHILPQVPLTKIKANIPGGKNACGPMGLISYFFDFIPVVSLSANLTVEMYSKLLHPFAASTLSSESISLVRALLHSSAWGKLVENIIIRMLKDSSGNSVQNFKALAALNILGGYVEPLRPGGMVLVNNSSKSGTQVRINKTIHSASGIVKKYNSRLNEVEVVYEAAYVKDFGTSALLCCDKVKPIAQVDADSTKFSKSLSNGLIDHFVSSLSKYMVLESVSSPEATAPKNETTPSKSDGAQDWKKKNYFYSGEEYHINNNIHFLHQLRAIINLFSNADNVRGFFEECRTSSNVCNQLLRIATVETEYCGVNQLELIEDILQTMITKRYAQRRDLATAAMAANDESLLKGERLPRLHTTKTRVGLNRAIRNVIARQFKGIGAENTAVQMLETILFGIFRSLLTILIDFTQQKSEVSENDMEDCVREFCSLRYFMMEDFVSSIVSSGQTYAHNHDQLKLDGWKHVVSSVESELKRAYLDLSQTKINIWETVPRYICGILNFFTCDMFELACSKSKNVTSTEITGALKEDKGFRRLLRFAENESDSTGELMAPVDGANVVISESSDGDFEEKDIELLMSHGFCREWCEMAMDYTDGDVQASVEYLLENGDDLENSYDELGSEYDSLEIDGLMAPLSFSDGPRHILEIEESNASEKEKVGDFVDDGMEEELEHGSNVTESDTHWSTRELQKDSKSAFKVYQNVLTALSGINGNVYPVGCDRTSFVAELSSATQEFMLDAIVGVSKAAIVLNARKLLMTLIWQRCLSCDVPFDFGVIFGKAGDLEMFFKFMRLVANRFTVPEWWLKLVSAGNETPISTTRTVFAEVLKSQFLIEREDQSFSDFFMSKLKANIADSAKRQFARKDHSEESYACLNDKKTLLEPNVFFDNWITSLVFDVEALCDKSNTDKQVRENSNQRCLNVFAIWAVALKSPSISLKQNVFRVLSSILQYVVTNLGDDEALSFENYLDLIPLSRITSMASRRIQRELEDHPVYSTYSQRLVEFASMAQLVKNKELRKDEMTVVSHSPLRKSDDSVSVAAFSANSYVSLSQFSNRRNAETESWTAEFWLKRARSAVPSDPKGSLEILASNASLKLYVACEGLTAKEAKLNYASKFVNVDKKRSGSSPRRPKKQTRKRGVNANPASQTKDKTEILMPVGNYVCCQIADNEPLKFNYRVPTNSWTHLAFVAVREGGKTVITLYANGQCVGSHVYFGCKIPLPNQYIGDKRSSFCGMLGEVRYWTVARSFEELRRDMVWSLKSIPEAVQEHLVGFWRFNVGSGCYIEDLSHHHTSTFAHNVEWAKEEAFKVKWNSVIDEDHSCSATTHWAKTCVGSWSRKGVKRLGDKWNHDDLKSSVLYLKIAQYTEKKKSEYQYSLSGTLELPGSGARFEIKGTILSRALVVKKDEKFIVDSSDETDEILNNSKVSFKIEALLWGAPETFKWFVDSEYRGAVSDGVFTGKWTNQVKTMKQFKALDHFEMGFVLPSSEAGSLMLSDNGKVLTSRSNRHGPPSWNACFINVGKHKEGAKESNVGVLKGRLWEIQLGSKDDYSQIAIGFAPPGIDPKGMLEKHSGGIFWNVNSERIFVNGRKRGRVCSRSVETMDIFGILLTEDTKHLFFFKNGTVVGFLKENDLSEGIKLDGLRPAVCLKKNVVVTLLGLKKGFGMVNYTNADIPEATKRGMVRLASPSSGIRSAHVFCASRYVGEWLNGLPNGHGSLFMRGELEVWKATWSSGQLDGVCELKQNGSTRKELFDQKVMYKAVHSALHYEQSKSEAFLFRHGERMEPVREYSDDSIFSNGTSSKKTAALDYDEDSPVKHDITGEFSYHFDKLFVLEPSLSRGGVKVDDDLQTATYTGGSEESGKAIILGNKGFSSGVHYWEVKAESVQWGSMTIGVSKKPRRSGGHIGGRDGFGDYGFISYRSTTDHYNGQRLYGRFFNSGDTIGVVLDMDRGIIFYIKDGFDNFIGKKTATNFGVAHRFVRSGGDGSIGFERQTLYPSFSLSSRDGVKDKISIKASKWMSVPSGSIRERLDDAIHAAMLIQNWKQSEHNLPVSLLQDSFHAMKRWCHGMREYKTRCGAHIVINPSSEAISHLCPSSEWAGGDRVYHDELGELQVLGVCSNRVWYQQDGDENGAWYWTKREVQVLIENGQVRLLQEGEEGEDPKITEGIANLANIFGDQNLGLEMGDYRTIMLINDGDVDQAMSWIFCHLEDYQSEIAAYRQAQKSEKSSASNYGGSTPGTESAEEAYDETNDADLSRLKEMGFDDFASSAQDSSLWTLQHDELLVKLIDNACAKSGAAPSHLVIKDLTLSGLSEHQIPRCAALTRFFVLLNLNRKIQTLLPVIDLSIERQALTVVNRDDIRFVSGLGQQLTSLKNIIFNCTKIKCWKEMIEATTLPTTPPDDEYDKPSGLRIVKINRIVGQPDKLLKLKDPATRFERSIFGQLYASCSDWSTGNFRRAFQDIQDEGQPRAFYVEFRGEGVDDHGGPYRAVFQSACGDDAELLGMLKVAEGSSKLVQEFADAPASLNEESLRRLQFLGRLMGTAVRHGIVLPLNLSSLIWKPLSGHHVDGEDLKEVAPSLWEIIYRGLSIDQKFLTRDILEDFQDQFEPHYSVLVGTGPPTPSSPRPVKLTRENFTNTCGRVKVSRLRRGNSQLESLFEGLSSVVPTELFCLFEPSGLEALFCGSKKMDLKLLKSKTEYADQLTEEDAHIQHFWKAMERMDEKQQALFLKFVSASERLPKSAADFQINFKIRRYTGEHDHQSRLPEGKTCFFELTLPEYSSEDVCLSKLLMAIENSPNMDGDFNMGDRAAYEDE
jgi:hypothetical protein